MRKGKTKEKLSKTVETQAKRNATQAGSQLTALSVQLARLTSHLALLLLLLSAGQQEVCGREVNVGVLGDGLLAQSHSADGGHVSFRSEDVERDSEGAADLANATEAFLIVGAGATDVDRNVVLDEACLVLAEGGDDA